MASDIEQYTRAAEWAAAIDSAAVEVLAVYRGQDPAAGNGKEFVEAVLEASWMPPPAVSRDTYNDMVSTGSLGLLPVTVREAIGAYYGQAEVYADREAIFREVLTEGIGKFQQWCWVPICCPGSGRQWQPHRRVISSGATG